MTRALIADPELVAKAARRPPGRDRSPASAATRRASATTTRARRSAASVNPRTGREAHVAPSGRRPPRRVLVIGGGPAGVAAAVEAARAGDAVTLVERAADIGGQLRLAGDTPGHAELWERYRALAWRATWRPRGSTCGSRPERRRRRPRAAPTR